MRQYKIVYRGGSGEITEKKSRFIAHVHPATSEEEALEFIEQIKKKYWDARHNCYAYVLGERGELMRFSDDGEPGGTAGKPMLEVLIGEEVRDTVVVVTRYFGGVLLGTGGLVRAYSQAAKEGLKNALICTKTSGERIALEADYTCLGKIQYLLAQRGIKIKESSYTDKVTFQFYVSAEEKQAVVKELGEATSGRLKLTTEANCWFAEIEGELKEWEIE